MAFLASSSVDASTCFEYHLIIKASRTLMSSEEMLWPGFESLENMVPTSGMDNQVLHAVLLSRYSKDETVSTQVYAWKKVNPFENSGVNVFAISWYAIELAFLPMPNRIQSVYKLVASRKWTASTTTSRSTVWIKH